MHSVIFVKTPWSAWYCLSHSCGLQPSFGTRISMLPVGLLLLATLAGLARASWI